MPAKYPFENFIRCDLFGRGDRERILQPHLCAQELVEIHIVIPSLTILRTVFEEKRNYGIFLNYGMNWRSLGFRHLVKFRNSVRLSDSVSLISEDGIRCALRVEQDRNVNKNVERLTDAIHAIRCLRFLRRIPMTFEMDDVIRGGDSKPTPATSGERMQMRKPSAR